MRDAASLVAAWMLAVAGSAPTAPPPRHSAS
jgi:hypothetical protein